MAAIRAAAASKGLPLFCLSSTLVSMAALIVAQPARGCTTDVYKQLDFWIGTWKVRVANGTIAGTDVVEKSLNGCVIYEHWTDVRGNKGLAS